MIDAKQIQRQRTVRYMIDAVKQIIEQEGADKVSIRKLAKIAGYSYATIYNYFTDLNELLWYVVAEYIDILNRRILEIEQQSSGLSYIKEAYHYYVSFYLENPAVYRFLYFKKLGLPPADVENKLKTPIFATKQSAALMKCVNEGIFDKSKVDTLGDLLTISTHGLLLLYFSDKMQMNKEELLKKLDTTIDDLFREFSRK